MLADRVRMAGGASAVSLSYVGACTGIGSTLNFASLDAGSIAANDLAIYMELAQGSGSHPSAVTPSGFTNVFNYTGGSEHRVMISYKVLTGSEGSVTGMNGDDNSNKVGLVYRPSRAIDTVVPLAGSSWNKTIADGGNPSTQTVTVAAQTPPVIVLALQASNSLPSGFSTASPAFDGTKTAGVIRVGRKLYNLSPSNHSIDMDDEGSRNTLVSGYIRVT